VIEAVNSNRTPQPQLEAIYLLMPTSANVERVIADFSHNRTQYAGAHLFFLDGRLPPSFPQFLSILRVTFRFSGLDEKLFSHLTTSPAEPHLKQLVELFLNIPAIEARVFSLNSPEMFFGFFSPLRDSLRAQARLNRVEVDIMLAAKVVGSSNLGVSIIVVLLCRLFRHLQLLNLCVTLNENPLIRYYQASHHGPLGPLVDHSPASSGPGQSSSTPGDANRRWARPLALRGESSTSIPSGDHLPKKLAFAVQAELDQYRKYNPEFPVGYGVFFSLFLCASLWTGWGIVS
jgi:syntaxin-binding protein 1